MNNSAGETKSSIRIPETSSGEMERFPVIWFDSACHVKQAYDTFRILQSSYPSTNYWKDWRFIKQILPAC